MMSQCPRNFHWDIFIDQLIWELYNYKMYVQDTFAAPLSNVLYTLFTLIRWKVFTARLFKAKACQKWARQWHCNIGLMTQWPEPSQSKPSFWYFREITEEREGGHLTVTLALCDHLYSHQNHRPEESQSERERENTQLFLKNLFFALSRVSPTQMQQINESN